MFWQRRSTKPILALKLSVSAIITPGGLPQGPEYEAGLLCKKHNLHYYKRQRGQGIPPCVMDSVLYDCQCLVLHWRDSVAPPGNKFIPFTWMLPEFPNSFMKCSMAGMIWLLKNINFIVVANFFFQRYGFFPSQCLRIPSFPHDKLKITESRWIYENQWRFLPALFSSPRLKVFVS